MTVSVWRHDSGMIRDRQESSQEGECVYVGVLCSEQSACTLQPGSLDIIGSAAFLQLWDIVSLKWHPDSPVLRCRVKQASRGIGTMLLVKVSV